MSDFQPNPEAVEEIENTLLAAGNADKAALDRVYELQQNADFFTYCACILAKETRQEPEYITARQLAGYQLKNNIGNPACTENQIVQQYTMETICDDNKGVRKAASAILCTATLRGIWPMEAVVGQLIDNLRSDSPNAIMGSMMSLSYLVEDLIEPLDAKRLTDQIINTLIPFLSHGELQVREPAIIAISICVEQAGIDMDGTCFNVLGGCIASVVETMLENINNGPEIKETQFILRTLVMSLAFYEAIEQGGYFERIGEIMLTATENATDEDIRKEAVQFWGAVLYFPNFSDQARPMMGRILPVLLQCMVYSDMELGMLCAREDDWEEPDKEDDIKPRTYEGRSHATADEDDDGDDEVEQHNLRRVAAHTLDDIAEHYGDEILDVALGTVNEMMDPSNDWKILEAAILAIGAVAEGCSVGMMAYLDVIVERLLEILSSAEVHFLVRNIALWAISRYPNFLMEPSKGQYLANYMNAILNHMVNPSKLVQEAATAALQSVADEANDGELNNFVTDVMDKVNRCFKLPYQLKNRYLLFECVQSLCTTFGRLLSEEQNLNLLMEPMMEYWQQTPNDSPMIFPFFECMSYVCEALGPFVEPVAEDIFNRSYQMICFHVEARNEAAKNNCEPPEPEFLIVALDLMSACLEALGSTLEPLVSQNEPNFMQYVLAACNDEDPQIRTSGFAVIGDMCCGCVNHVQEMLDEVCTSMVDNLQNVNTNDTSIKVASNVGWAFGELISNQNMDHNNQIGPGHTQTIMPLLMRVLEMIQDAEDKNVAENAALAIGRVLTVDPDALGYYQGNTGAVVNKWVECMRNVKNMPQKEQAVRGMLAQATADPGSCCDALGLWIDLFAGLAPPPDLRNEIKQLLQQIKNGMGQNFSNALNSMSTETTKKLYQIYAVR